MIAAIAIAAVVAMLAVVGLIAAVVMHVKPQATSSTQIMMYAAPVSNTQVANNVAPVPPAAAVPSPMGRWTSARGIQIAQRALAWVGWPYSWDAGNASGPTYGQAIDSASRNDSRILGFDCSGLVMYAMAQFTSLDHSAAGQYTESGSFHPALDSLQPGDLLFWSKDGTIGGIGHVAIYLGNGNVVEAPHSGDRIKVISANDVESGTIGATRPLT
ncbi:MAG: NlpC/P60 family protein [Actinomycetota bacterium]|nr:NlpC/P60 family protein [Actinomycetota bacterium]